MKGSIYGLHLVGDDEIRYVGLTRQPLRKRLLQHRAASRIGAKAGKRQRQSVYNWIRKHGESAIGIRLLEEAPLETLGEREKWYISKLAEEGHDLLNITIGGGHCKPTTEEMRRNYSNGQYSRKVRGGWKLSEEFRKEIGIRSTGRRHSEEARQKISKARMGMKFTEEHRQNLVLSHAGQRRLTDEQVGSLVGVQYENGLFSRLSKEWGVTTSTIAKYYRKANAELNA